MPWALVPSFISKNVSPMVDEFTDLKRRLFLGTYFCWQMLDGEVPQPFTQSKKLNLSQICLHLTRFWRDLVQDTAS